MARSLVLGVDGGNTKTLAAVATEAGEIVGLGRGAGSDIHGRETPQAALDEIEAVARAALSAAGVGAGELSAAAFSLAGADWPEDFELLQRELSTRLAPSMMTIVNDSLGALRLGAADWTGIAIACGTYNAIAARNGDGRVFHFGFWPDSVGGQELGSRALKAVYREGLGLGPPTALTARILSMFGAADPADLVHAFTRLERPRPSRDVRGLAPLLLDVADAGDPVARAIVGECGDILGQQARVCAERVGLPLEGATLVLTGGVLLHPSGLLEAAILTRLPGVRPVRTMAPPLVGALLLAYDAAGRAMTAETLANSLSAHHAF